MEGKYLGTCQGPTSSGGLESLERRKGFTAPLVGGLRRGPRPSKRTNEPGIRGNAKHMESDGLVSRKRNYLHSKVSNGDED